MKASHCKCLCTWDRKDGGGVTLKGEAADRSRQRLGVSSTSGAIGWTLRSCDSDVQQHVSGSFRRKSFRLLEGKRNMAVKDFNPIKLLNKII